MESIGQGIAYRNIEGCTRELSDEAIKGICREYTAVHEELARLGQLGSLIVDCHSFPCDLAPEIDICIGYNKDDSKPSKEILDVVVNHFRDAGFKVGVNEPYSNSIRVHDSIPTLMIEINKNIYLCKDGKTLKDDWYEINRLINELYLKLLG